MPSQFASNSILSQQSTTISFHRKEKKAAEETSLEVDFEMETRKFRIIALMSLCFGIAIACSGGKKEDEKKDDGM